MAYAIKCSNHGVWVVEGSLGEEGWRAMAHSAKSKIVPWWVQSTWLFKKCEGRKWGVAWPFSLLPSNKVGWGLVASSSKMVWPYVIEIFMYWAYIIRHWEWWQGSLHSALVSGAEISLSAFDLSATHLVVLCSLGVPICSTHAFFIISCHPHLPLNHWCKNSLVFPKCYTEYCLEGKTYHMLVPLANF